MKQYMKLELTSQGVHLGFLDTGSIGVSLPMTAEPTPEPSPPVATDEAAPAPEPPAARRIIEGDLVWVTYHGHKHAARVQRIDRWSPGDDVPERPPRYTVRYERTWTKRADDSEDESSAHSDASFDDEVEQAPASACSRCV